MAKNFHLTFLGHSGFYLEGPSFGLLIDPRVFDGGYGGTRFQWPPLKPFGDIINHVKKLFIYISNYYEDQSNLTNSAYWGAYNTILCPNFMKSFWKKCPHYGKMNFTFLNNRQKMQLPDNCSIEVFTSGKNSACFINTPEFTFLYLNDCDLFDRVNELPKNPTFLAGSYSRVSWYPICFNYNDDIMDQKIEKVKEAQLRNFTHLLDIVSPKNFIPTASPPLIVNNYVRKFTKIFPFPEEYLRYYLLHSRNKDVVFNELPPASPVSLLSHKRHQWIRHSLEEYIEYRNKYFNTHYLSPSIVDVTTLLKNIAESLRVKLDSCTNKILEKITRSIRFRCRGVGDVYINFQNKKVAVEKEAQFSDGIIDVIIYSDINSFAKLANGMLWYNWFMTLDYVVESYTPINKELVDFLFLEAKDLSNYR